MKMKWITHSFLLSLIWKVTYVCPLTARNSMTEVVTATEDTEVGFPEKQNSRDKRSNTFVQPQPIRTNSDQKRRRESFTVYLGGQKVTSKKESPGRHWIGVGRKVGTAVSKQVVRVLSKVKCKLEQKSSKKDCEMSASKREPSMKRMDSSGSSSSYSSSSSGTYSSSSGRQSSGRESPGRESPGQESPGRGSPSRESPGRERPGRERPGGESPGRESPGRESPGRGSPPRTGERSRPSKSFAATLLKMDDSSWLAATKPKATNLLSPSRTPKSPGQSSRRPESPPEAVEDPGQSSRRPSESPPETLEDPLQRKMSVLKTLVKRSPRSWSEKEKFLEGLKGTESQKDPSAVELSRSESFRKESKEKPVRERERSVMEVGRMNNVRASVEDDPCNKWAPGIRTMLNVWCYRMAMELQSLPKDLTGRCHHSIYAECRPTIYRRSDGSLFEQYDCTMLDVLDKVLLNQKDVEEHNVWPKYKITRTDIVYFYECAKLTVEELYRTGKKAPPKLFFEDPRVRDYRRDSDYESDEKRWWKSLFLPSFRLPSNLNVSHSVGVALKNLKGFTKWKKKHREETSKEKSKPRGRSKEDQGSSSQ